VPRLCAGALSEYLKIDKRVRTLSLNCNGYRDGGMASLASMLRDNYHLTCLDLSGSRATDAGYVAVCEALASGCSGGVRRSGAPVASLFLSRSSLGLGMGQTAAVALGSLVRATATLTTLGLWGSRMGDAGAAEVAAALKDNATLTSLDLGWNEVGDAGVASLARALECNETLTKLDLRNNAVGRGGVDALLAVVGLVEATPETARVGNVTLAELDLGGNPLLVSPDLEPVETKFGVPTLAPAWRGMRPSEEQKRAQRLRNGVLARFGDDTPSDGHTSGTSSGDDSGGEEGAADPRLEERRRRQREERRELRSARRRRRASRAARSKARLAAVDADFRAASSAAAALLDLQALLTPEARRGRVAEAEALREAKVAQAEEWAKLGAHAASQKAADDARWNANRAAFLGREYTDRIPEREAARLWKNVGDDPRGWRK